MSVRRVSKPQASPTIRLADSRDACDIALLSRSEIEYGLPWAWTPETVARAISNRDMNVVVATTLDNTETAAQDMDNQHTLCGFALVYFGRTHAHINLLAVGKPYQRCGLGRKLLDWQIASARTAGIRYLTLEVRRTNKGAQGFYSDCGFETRDTVSRYYNNKEDALRMIRKLEVQHES